MSSITVLGLDSALTGCSVALIARSELLAERRWLGERGQAESLLPLVEETMAAAATAFTALDLIAVTVGPGAFTGLRIGLAAALGLSLGTDRPLAGVTTLEAVAAATNPEERSGRTLVVALETKRQDLYLQCFDRDLAALSEPAAVAALRFAAWVPAGKLVLAGDGAARLAGSLSGRDVAISAAAGVPEAARVARIAAFRHGTPAARRGVPLYLRAPDVSLPAASLVAPIMPAGAAG